MALRRSATGALALSVAVPAVLTLPVTALPSASPRPVAPEVQQIAIDGIDRGALPDLALPRKDVRFDAPEARAHAAELESGELVALSTETSTEPFRLAGVTWDPSTDLDVHVWVRTRTDDAWTDWTELEQAHDLPDAGTAEGDRVRAGTMPLIAPGSDGIQVRVETPSGETPADLRVDLVDPGTSAADAGTAPVSSAAAAMAATPAIVTRAQWGADESLRDPSPNYTSTLQTGFVHHTASSNSYWQRSGWTAADAARDIRSIYAYAVRSQGYADIPYNFIVDQAGRIYEGRAGGVNLPVLSGATGGFNSKTFAVSALGNLQDASPTSAMVEGFSRIFAYKLDLSHRNPYGTSYLTSTGSGTSRYGNGVTVGVPVIAGHRDVGETACPGFRLYAQLNAIRAKVKVKMGPAFYDPSLSQSLFPAGEAGTASIAVNANQTLRWDLKVLNANGAQIRSFTGVKSGAGWFSIPWNLTDGAGALVPVGSYRLELSMKDLNGVLTRPWTGYVDVRSMRTPPKPSIPDVYTTPGYRIVNGREWKTECGLYSADGAMRCYAYIKATQTVRSGGSYRTSYGWVLNSLTYMAYDSPSWSANILATPGTKSSAGRTWKVTCTPNASTGERICRSYLYAKVVSRTTVGGRYVYREYWAWTFNNVVYVAAS